MQHASLLVVDDHPLFADGFVQMVHSLRPNWSVRVARSAGEAQAIVGDGAFDLIVVDVRLSDGDGCELVRDCRRRDPRARLIVISGREDAAIRARARACGADGFLAKTAEPAAMIDALGVVLVGGTAFEPRAGDALPMLTPRQGEILVLLAQGHGNKEIRYRLGIAERTVRAHLTELFHLLGVGSRMNAIIRAREIGLVE